MSVVKKRFLWPQAQDSNGGDVVVPIQYFLSRENAFAMSPPARIAMFSSDVEYLDVTDEKKEKIRAFAPEFKSKCFKLALATTVYLKHLNGGLNQNQIRRMADGFEYFKKMLRGSRMRLTNWVRARNIPCGNHYLGYWSKHTNTKHFFCRTTRVHYSIQMLLLSRVISVSWYGEYYCTTNPLTLLFFISPQ